MDSTGIVIFRDEPFSFCLLVCYRGILEYLSWKFPGITVDRGEWNLLEVSAKSYQRQPLNDFKTSLFPIFIEFSSVLL